MHRSLGFRVAMALALLGLLPFVSSMQRFLNPVVRDIASSQEAHSNRRLQQIGDDMWEVFVVNDWTSLFNAVIMTQEPNKNVRVVLTNHIVGNGKALDFRIHGGGVTSPCGTLPHLTTR